MPAATAAADPPLEPPGTRSKCDRVAYWSIPGIFRRRPHSKLIAVQLSYQHRTCSLETLDHGSVIGRPIAFEDAGARSSWGALHHQHVLDTNGNAGQRGQRTPLGGELVDGRSCVERTLATQRKISIDDRILRLNLRKTKLRQLGCAGVCMAHRCLNLGNTSLLPIHNSIIVPGEGSGNQFCLAANLRPWFFWPYIIWRYRTYSLPRLTPGGIDLHAAPSCIRKQVACGISNRVF